jgi:hypothetical protein
MSRVANLTNNPFHTLHLAVETAAAPTLLPFRKAYAYRRKTEALLLYSKPIYTGYATSSVH